MKVNGSDLQSKLSVYQTAQVQDKKNELAKSKASDGPIPLQDRVALSGRGRQIADAQRAMAAVPDVREALVSRIQSDVQEGNYIVDNQKVAQGLLRESLENQAAMV